MCAQCEAMWARGLFYWHYLETSLQKDPHQLRSPWLKPCLSPGLIQSRALAEETEAAFGCCWLSTLRDLHLWGAKQKFPWALAGATSALWELCSCPLSALQTFRCAAGATISISVSLLSDGLGAERRQRGFAKRRRDLGFSRLQRKQEKKVILFRRDDVYFI